MSNDTKKELEKGKCSACWGKGFYTQLHGIQGFADFIGDKGFETGSTEHKYPCSRCNGSGNEPVQSKNPMEEKCSQCELEGNNGVCDRKDCKNSYQSPLEVPNRINLKTEREQEIVKKAFSMGYKEGEKAICDLILSKAKENYSGSSSFLVLDDKAITEIMQILNKEKLLKSTNES